MIDKMYKQYIKEREGKEVIESDKGFAIYSYGILNNIRHCYIEDIYIVPTHRNSYEASELANKIIKIAKKECCTILYGSVDITANNSDKSMMVLLKYKMIPSHINGNVVYFKREI